MKKQRIGSILAAGLILLMTACGQTHVTSVDLEESTISADIPNVEMRELPDRDSSSLDQDPSKESTEQDISAYPESEEAKETEQEEYEIPPYNGEPSVPIHGNKPLFTEEELIPVSFEKYSELDELGRCGVAFACVGLDLMPTEERGSIGEIHPSGWHTVKYEGIDGNYLYNRCHLIAHSLTGEDANERNLITGTRYMNKDGMNPYEILVTDYIRETGNHVLYRVRPIFEGTNLVASGVTMEARSIEDDEICFFVYCYNVQPGVEIDYATGESTGPEYTGEALDEGKSETEEIQIPEDTTYVLNTNTMRFHYPDCDSVREMSEKNRLPVNSSREELIEDGYKPCGNCKP